jgi:site-specific recombinase XerD
MGLYRRLAAKFVELNGDRLLSGYTSLEFEQSRVKTIADGISVTRMNLYTRAIKTMFHFALKQNIIQNNPLENVKQIKQRKSGPAFFTYEDLNKITALVNSANVKSMFKQFS